MELCSYMGSGIYTGTGRCIEETRILDGGYWSAFTWAFARFDFHTAHLVPRPNLDPLYSFGPEAEGEERPERSKLPSSKQN